MEPSHGSVVPKRVAGVTLALAGTGAVLGAGLTAAVLGIVGFGLRLASMTLVGPPLPAVAGVGGALGAILTPLTAFSLLRRVALGKAILGTMLGMSLGTGIGLVASGRLIVAAAAGVGGFMLAALVLRLRAGGEPPKGNAREE
jgi:hypothetical protein